MISAPRQATQDPTCDRHRHLWRSPRCLAGFCLRHLSVARSDDEAVAGGIHDGGGDGVRAVEAHDPAHLRTRASEGRSPVWFSSMRRPRSMAVSRRSTAAIASTPSRLLGSKVIPNVAAWRQATGCLPILGVVEAGAVKNRPRRARAVSGMIDVTGA